MTVERRGATVLETLREVSERYNLDYLDEDIERLASDHSVQVGFLGEFSSGKSTLINELTGIDDLMPVSLEPTTANAGQVVSVPDLQEPEYFRVDPNGELVEITRPDFDELACGRGNVKGRPLARLPSCPGLPTGFIFLDTPGLESLTKEHTEITLGELPFVDAAVICVDIRKGGLTRSVTEFLKSTGTRHLQHRFLLALTFADLLPATEREEVVEKIASTLAQTIDCSESEAMGRIVVVSAGPKAGERDVSALRTAIQEVFEKRREALMAERQGRSAGRLVPRAISLLDHVRKGLLESDDDFASRKTEADEKDTQLEEELKRQRQRLAKSKDDLSRDVQMTCNSFSFRFANESDLEAVSRDFHTALEQTVRTRLEKFGEDRKDTSSIGVLDAEIQRTTKDIDKLTGLGAMIATAAVTAAIMPGVGAAATAGEAGAGAAIRQVGQNVARNAARNAAKDTAKDVLKKVLIAVHEHNPINTASERLAVWLKEKQIAEPMEQIGQNISNQAAQMLETYFESEVFAPLEREQAEVQSTLKQIQTERRTALTERMDKVSRVEADIKCLEKLKES